MKKLTILFAFAALLTACNSGLPKEFRQSEALPNIYPDYTDVTVPINIAPLTFEIDGTPQEMAVRFTAGQQEVICTGERSNPLPMTGRRWSRVLQGKPSR